MRASFGFIRSVARGVAAGLVLCLVGSGAPAARPVRQADAPVAALHDAGRLAPIRTLVEAAIADRHLPGAVILAGRGDRIVYREAFGHRALEPAREPMTVDTIFDLASLTKVVATTTSVMLLVEEGRLRLSDRVADFVPGFDRHGKDEITILHLLTHTSGLRPDVDLVETWVGYDEAIRRAVDEVPAARPGERFVYSDINFFLLGDLVARLAAMPLETFTRTRIFEPLGMRDTGFHPPASVRPRIAPTEACTPYGWPCGGPGAEMLRGVVHDPTARRMGGVAGHAGLFGTAEDLSRFCRMLLGGGSLEGTRVLSPLSVARMTRPATPPGQPSVRGLGWDIDSPFSSNRGDLFPLGSYGHTGFTGTSIWIDPSTDTYVIFLSSRVHPDGGGSVTALRGKIATVVAAAHVGPRLVEGRADASSGAVLAGIDVLEREGFARLRGRRVGLITNQAGRSRSGASTIDLLFTAPDVDLRSLMSPEHGIRGELEGSVPSSQDPDTGLPIHSLYGATRRPSADMLDGLDTLVVDLQDVGSRFYTYATTMAYAMEEAARRRIRVVVLDRPNPINGAQVEGPLLDAGSEGFTGYHPMPIRHGLTMGELARLFNAERNLGVDLEVVEMTGWRRATWFDATGLAWVNPSPNMRSLTQATLYPGIGAIEGTNISVGRGTDSPFEQIGAPWIDGMRLASELNARGLPGIRFYPVRFTPRASRYAGQACEGVFMVVTDRMALRPVLVGIEIAAALRRLFGSRFDLESSRALVGSAGTLAQLMEGADPRAVAAGWAAAETQWREIRAPYLLYR